MRVDPADFDGQRLRVARLRAGLTLVELAARVDVSRPALSQYEADRVRPTAAVLAQLAMALGVRPTFFSVRVTGRRSAVGEQTHFRSLRSTTVRARDQAWAWSETALDLVDVIEQHVRLPSVALPMLPIPNGAQRQLIARAAAEVRTAWGLPAGPVGHLLRNLEANGIVVTVLPQADIGIDAFSRGDGARPLVVLTATKADPGRRRFDAAHELGHLVCHPRADPGGAHEQQAHAFAAELLMPEELIVAELPRRFDLAAYGKLKLRWGVTIAALLYRARTLAVIGESAYRRSVVTMNRRYGRRFEPYDLPMEQPVMLSRAVQLLAQVGMDRAELASCAGLPESAVEEVVDAGDPRPVVRL